MSQYPSPYNTPYPGNYGFDPAAGLLAPAKRAAILMFVLGGLNLACGACVGVFARIGPIDQLVARANVQLPPDLNMPPEQLFRIFLGILAALSLLHAIAMIILAVFVRRGGIGSIVTSIVLCVLVLLLLAMQGIGAVVRGAAGQPQGLIFFVIGIGLYGLLFAWLIQAARAAAAVKTMRMQSQLWQIQQQQQMYGQGGYAPPPPPPPPPPPQQTPPQIPPQPPGG
jgi:hypothetical protein